MGTGFQIALKQFGAPSGLGILFPKACSFSLNLMKLESAPVSRMTTKRFVDRTIRPRFVYTLYLHFDTMKTALTWDSFLTQIHERCGKPIPAWFTTKGWPMGFVWYKIQFSIFFDNDPKFIRKHRLVFRIGLLSGHGVYVVGLCCSQIRFWIFIWGIRYLCFLLGREDLIILDQVIDLVQLQRSLRCDITLMITTVAHYLPVFGVYPP